MVVSIYYEFPKPEFPKPRLLYAIGDRWYTNKKPLQEDRWDSSMSISIAIIGLDGIVIATDDMETIMGKEMLIHRSGAKKLWVLKDRFGLMAVNTNEGFSTWVINEFIRSLSNPKESFPVRLLFAHRDIEKVLGMLDIGRYEDILFYFSAFIYSTCRAHAQDDELIMKSDIFNLGFTLAGYESNGEPQIHSISASQLFQPSIKHDYYIAGIPSIGNYYMQKLWSYLFEKQGDRICPLKSINVLNKLATLLIMETHKYSENVSDKVTLYTITKDKIEPVKEDEMKDIMGETQKITDDSKLIELLSNK